MAHIFTNMTVTPAIPALDIHVGQLWRDYVLDITYRVLVKNASGAYMRCISDVTGKVWYDTMPFECFATELTLVN